VRAHCLGGGFISLIFYMNSIKKTKIVCTIGPATTSVEKLTELVNAGMNMMRLNFSHGDFAEHQEKVDNLRKVLKKISTRLLFCKI
jgi:pyruvate kinase